VRGARANNLSAVDVEIPLDLALRGDWPQRLRQEHLGGGDPLPRVARALGDSRVPRAGDHDELLGAESGGARVPGRPAPLGRTRAGNAATYTKAWDRFRALFASTPEAEARGFTASHFSFNVGGDSTRSGRCEACSGEGYETVEMQFLADVTLLCAVCQGKTLPARGARGEASRLRHQPGAGDDRRGGAARLRSAGRRARYVLRAGSTRW